MVFVRFSFFPQFIRHLDNMVQRVKANRKQQSNWAWGIIIDYYYYLQLFRAETKTKIELEIIITEQHVKKQNKKMLMFLGNVVTAYGRPIWNNNNLRLPSQRCLGSLKLLLFFVLVSCTVIYCTVISFCLVLCSLCLCIWSHVYVYLSSFPFNRWLFSFYVSRWFASRAMKSLDQ